MRRVTVWQFEMTKGREIMRLRSTAVLASLSKRKITIGAQQLRQLTASTAVYVAPDVHTPMNVRKCIVSLPGIMALAAGITVADGGAAWQAARAQAITNIGARVVAVNVPGASAISQV